MLRGTGKHTCVRTRTESFVQHVRSMVNCLQLVGCACECQLSHDIAPHRLWTTLRSPQHEARVASMMNDSIDRH